jgi:hypothetical protein
MWYIFENMVGGGFLQRALSVKPLLKTLLFF